MKGQFTEHSQYVVKINCDIIMYKEKWKKINFLKEEILLSFNKLN